MKSDVLKMYKCVLYTLILYTMNIWWYAYLKSWLLLNKKYCVSETFLYCKEHVGAYISWKIMPRSRDPQGQFQGQNLGQKVKTPQHVPIVKMITDLESLFNSLSNNTHFEKISPVVFEIQGFKCRQPRPFLPKISKFDGPYLVNPWPDWPKIWNLVLWDHTKQVY